MTKKPAATQTAAATEQPKEDTGKAIAVVSLKAGAMSTEIGPRVIADFAQTFEDEAKVNDTIKKIEGKRFDMMASLTAGIVKAAKGDDSVNLAVAFGDDKKAMNKLNDQLRLALGIMVVQTTEVNGKPVEKLVLAKGLDKYFPGPKEDKTSAAYIRKNTLRSNFTHMLKKTTQAAAEIVAKGIEAKMDSKSGTLLLSGPEIKKQFGTDSVLLNDKQSVGEGDNKVTLKAKPSFTQLAKLGAESHGKKLETRKDSRVNTTAVDPDTALQSICDTLVKAIAKLKEKPSAKTVEALNSVKSAIDKVTKQ